MRIPRRAAIVAAGAALAMPALPRFARSAEYVWRIAHTAPPGFPLHVRLVEAATRIARESGGRIELTVIPDSAAGGQMGLFAQLRAGALEMAPMTGQALSSALSVAAAPMTGFAFAGYDALWPAMDGDLGKIVREQAALRLGLVAMDRIWDFGFRQITTSARPVREAADLDGQRIRMAGETDLLALFRALKALPVAMPLANLSQALRVKSVDGQEGRLPLAVVLRLFEVQSDCALTNHVWDGQWICVHAGSWTRLADRLKAVVADALNDAAMLQRADSAAAELETAEFLSAKGMIVATVEPTSFREKLRAAGYYKELRVRLGDEVWSALEKHAGRLA